MPPPFSAPLSPLLHLPALLSARSHLEEAESCYKRQPQQHAGQEENPLKTGMTESRSESKSVAESKFRDMSEFPLQKAALWHFPVLLGSPPAHAEQPSKAARSLHEPLVQLFVEPYRRVRAAAGCMGCVCRMDR